MNKTNNAAQNQPPARKIDWATLTLALLAGFGLALSVITAWDAWRAPMDFIPDNYWPVMLGLTATLGGAIVLTFRPHFTSLRVFIACAILAGIFLQLNLLGVTETSHKPTGAATSAHNGQAPTTATPAPIVAPTAVPAPAATPVVTPSK